MSYARFGKDSDVYVYAHYAGYVECCGCVQAADKDEPFVKWYSPDAVVEHMREHDATGDMVPDYLFDPALYPPEDFVPSCTAFMCRQDEGHEGNHTTHRWRDPFPATSPASNAYRCPCGSPREHAVHAV